MADDQNIPDNSQTLGHGSHEEGRTAPAEAVEGAMEAVQRRMEAHLGPVVTVFQELVSDVVHLDVHVIAPNEKCPHYVLFTTGMGDLPMTLPEGIEAEPRAELMLALPPDWKIGSADFEDERWYWPIRNFKALARLPHQCETWLSPGHTIPHGDPPEPYTEGVPFCCAMIAPPLLLPEDAHVVQLSNGDALRMLAVLWLHPGEVVLKLNKGADSLYERFDAMGASELLDMGRPDVSRRKGLQL